MIEQPIRVGLIGFGIAGQVFHAPVIKAVPALELYKVTARKTEQIDMLKNKYPDALVVSNAQDIFSDDSIELVVIATSNDMHYTLTKEALEAGKHVVVEKPFTNTTAQADELIALAKEKGKLPTVHHKARWHSDYLTIKKVIEQEKVGQLVAFEARYDRFRNYLRPNAWREENLPGSGILYDLGAHLIDQSLQLFGFPEAVNADLRIQREGARAVDDFEVILHYPSLKVSLKGTMLAKEPTPRYNLFGWKGTFTKYGNDPQEAMLRAGYLPHLIEDWGLEDPSIYGKLNIIQDGEDYITLIESERGNFPGYYANVAAAIRGQEPLAVQAVEARNVIRIIELAEQSWAERRTIDVGQELISE